MKDKVLRWCVEYSIDYTGLHPQGKGGPKGTLCRISSDSVRLDQFVHESYSWVRQILFRIDQFDQKSPNLVLFLISLYTNPIPESAKNRISNCSNETH